MVKKGIYLSLITLFILAFGITSWAYWRDELKVKTDIPLVYAVNVEVEEVESKSVELTEPNESEGKDGEENNTESTKEDVKGESAQDTKDNESVKEDPKESSGENTKETAKEASKENVQDTNDAGNVKEDKGSSDENLKEAEKEEVKEAVEEAAALE